ncbi:hypothetical protein GpartN1_g867.t1 [Galdieria partita]|uniref:Thiol-disulfide oxidoreductase DCC n=1 Tax=Galdieria partita TaxID=83374 RepID=A0A9C7PSM6_9RHOD|nr:hypothetical protein GpartN1_g867.t1 [Galdieria partita]
MRTFFVLPNFLVGPSFRLSRRKYNSDFNLSVNISSKQPSLPRNRNWRSLIVPHVRLCLPAETETSTRMSQSKTPSWKYKLLYDGQCPLCRKEVAFLQKHDDSRGIICFVDISDKYYSPSDNAGIDYKTAMGRIHAIRNDGMVVRDMEVFRAVYDALGIGWIYFPTKLPIIKPIADLLYRIWAKLRLPLTGRKLV